MKALPHRECEAEYTGLSTTRSMQIISKLCMSKDAIIPFFAVMSLCTMLAVLN
jgi:hypothetical protein